MKAIILKIIAALMLIPACLTSRKDRRRQIVVLRCDEFGDFLLWLGAAAALRQRYPAEEWRITVIVRPFMAELAGRCPYFDNIEIVDTRLYPDNFLYRLRVLFNMRQLNVEIAINAVIDRNPTNDHLLRFIRAKRKIGFRPVNCHLEPGRADKLLESESYYSELVELPHNQPIVYSFFKLIAAADACSSPRLDDLAFLGKLPRMLHDNYIIVVPGAGLSRRCWDPSRFAELLRRWPRSLPTVVFAGTAAESKLAAAVIAQLPATTSVINICGKTTLIELAAWVRHAGFVVSNDTGTAHSAALMDIPTVVILGSGHLNFFFPYPEEFQKNCCKAIFADCPQTGCCWQCYEFDSSLPYPCIAAVSVDSVLFQVQELLEKLRVNG